MSDEPTVHVSATTLTRAWRTAGREEFWIQLTTTHADRDTFAAAIQELEDPLDDVCFLVRTHGTVPKGYVALVSGTGDDTQLVVWADALARRLEAHGVTGTLTGVTPEHPTGSAPNHPCRPRSSPGPTTLPTSRPTR